MLKKTIIIAVGAIVMTSCGCLQRQPIVVIRDSVRTEYRDRIVHDTIDYELPVIIEKHITDDTLSVIENDYAKSTAVVRDGLLSHGLETKQTPIRIPVTMEVHDTLIVETAGQTIVQEKIVEKELKWYQTFLIGTGLGALIGLALLAIFFIVKAICKGGIFH